MVETAPGTGTREVDLQAAGQLAPPSRTEAEIDEISEIISTPPPGALRALLFIMAALMAAGLYDVTVRKQAGGAPAWPADLVVGAGSVDWAGAAVRTPPQAPKSIPLPRRLRRLAPPRRRWPGASPRFGTVDGRAAPAQKNTSFLQPPFRSRYLPAVE